MTEAWVLSFAALVDGLQLERLNSGSYTSARDPGEPGYNKRRVSITGQEGAILAALADGKIVLEIGTGLGVSTHHLASTAREVITCDVDAWVHEHVWPLLRGLSNVRCVDEVPRVHVDMAFIDGCHWPVAILNDMVRTRSVIQAGGVVVLHDVNHTAVRDTIAKDMCIERTYTTTHGLGV